MIKAIETRYAGCRFRSRLEARWAVFFDAMGIKWEYEKEGYDLLAGWYLPDFWLPEYELFWEVKGTAPSEREENLAFDLSCHTGYPTVIVDGDIPRTDIPGSLTGRPFVLTGLFHGNINGWHSICPACGKYTVNVNPEIEARRGICPCRPGMGEDSGFANGLISNFVFSAEGKVEFDGKNREHAALLSKNVDAFIYMVNAFDKARSARFEHGEHG